MDSDPNTVWSFTDSMGEGYTWSQDYTAEEAIRGFDWMPAAEQDRILSEIDAAGGPALVYVKPDGSMIPAGEATPADVLYAAEYVDPDFPDLDDWSFYMPPIDGALDSTGDPLSSDYDLLT